MTYWIKHLYNCRSSISLNLRQRINCSKNLGVPAFHESITKLLIHWLLKLPKDEKYQDLCRYPLSLRCHGNITPKACNIENCAEDFRSQPPQRGGLRCFWREGFSMCLKLDHFPERVKTKHQLSNHHNITNRTSITFGKDLAWMNQSNPPISSLRGHWWFRTMIELWKTPSIALFSEAPSWGIQRKCLLLENSRLIWQDLRKWKHQNLSKSWKLPVVEGNLQVAKCTCLEN